MGCLINDETVETHGHDSDYRKLESRERRVEKEEGADESETFSGSGFL